MASTKKRRAVLKRIGNSCRVIVLSVSVVVFVVRILFQFRGFKIFRRLLVVAMKVTGVTLTS